MSDPLKICVVGTGHIGLPLAAVLADAGFSVVGYDTNDDFVTRVNTTGTVWLGLSALVFLLVHLPFDKAALSGAPAPAGSARRLTNRSERRRKTRRA